MLAVREKHASVESANGGAPSRSKIAELFSLSPVEASIFLTFLVYAALFIWRSSFSIGGVRYFCLFDDDMISMTYAANLAHGYGLVWNPGGHRVLGFTNLLWVLYLSLFHLLPISAAKISLFIQASGAVFLGLSLLITRRIGQAAFPDQPGVGTLSMLLVGLYGPLVNWSLQGTEVSLLTLFVTGSVWLALDAVGSESPAFLLYLVLGVSTLCRVDMAVFAGIVLLSLSFACPSRWRWHLLVGGLIVGAFLLAQFSFNLAYYGEPLPNTYYLKLTGYPISGRLRSGLKAALILFLPLLPLIAIVLGTVSVRRMRNEYRLTLVAPLVGQMLYSIWVGGDAWEWWGGANRYISIVMPLFFVLVSSALLNYAGIISRLAGGTGRLRWYAERSALAVFAVAALFLTNVYHLRNNLLLASPLQTAKSHEPWNCNEDMVRQALLIRSLTERHARIAVVWAGAIPYFARRSAIDLLGKNDVKIAHEPMHVESKIARDHGFWPGHLKWDYQYSIERLKPDVVLQLWGVGSKDLPFLTAKYVPVSVSGFTWYVRSDSRQLREPLQHALAAESK